MNFEIAASTVYSYGRPSITNVGRDNPGSRRAAAAAKREIREEGCKGLVDGRKWQRHDGGSQKRVRSVNVRQRGHGRRDEVPVPMKRIIAVMGALVAGASSCRA